jgi:hypothetical protein
MLANRLASHCFLFLVLAGISLQAQKLNDLTVYPAPPAPTLPPAGGTFQDPVFGTTILRVTDANDGALNMPFYSSIWPAFNADSSRIAYFIGNGTTMIANLDVPNRKVSNKRAMPSTPNGLPATSYWHRTDPDIFFAFAGSVLWEYSFKIAQYTKVVDFSTLVPGVAYVGSRGMSDDGNRFQITVSDSNFQNVPGADGIFIYDLSKNALVYQVAPNRTGGSTKSQMDASGRYILALNYLVDSVTDQAFNIVNEGHTDANFGMVATYLGNGNGWFPGYRLLNPNGAGYLTAHLVGPQGPWTDDAHFGLADINGEWLTGSYENDDFPQRQDAAGNYMTTPGWQWTWDSQPPNATGHWTWIGPGPQPSQTPFPLDIVYEGEVFQTSLKVPSLTVVQQWDQPTANAVPVGPVTLPNGKIYATWAEFQANENINTVLSANPVNRRICKHYSQPLIAANPGIAYWAQPHAIGSPDNRAVMFGSNFGDPNRVDVFVAFIDADSKNCSHNASFNLNAQFITKRGGFAYNSGTKRFVQTLTIMNTGTIAVSGPIYLALDDLSGNASLANSSGTTSCTSPDSPYIIAVPSGSVAAGQSVKVQLQFADPSKAGISYSTRIIAGMETP